MVLIAFKFHQNKTSATTGASSATQVSFLFLVYYDFCNVFRLLSFHIFPLISLLIHNDFLLLQSKPVATGASSATQVFFLA